jgi:hypothetical protein
MIGHKQENIPTNVDMNLAECDQNVGIVSAQNDSCRMREADEMPV